MAISKVVYDGSTLIDLTSDSVNASNLSKGTTAHNAAGEQIIGTFEQAQSDWNQNDETAVDYVKNRPFYTGNPVETVFFEESTLSFLDYGGVYGYEGQSSFIATVGETYTIYWDSTAYECVGVNSQGLSCLGNQHIGLEGVDTGEPFLVTMVDNYMTIYTEDTSSSHIISIKGFPKEIVKIDTKYLPFMSKPDGESYLTFSSKNSFSIVTAGKSWDGTLEYFTSDNTWATWDGTNVLSAATNGAEYVLYLRGIGNTVVTGDSYWNFRGSVSECIGNIENLLDYATVEAGEHPIMADHCYYGMFRDCTSLTKAPELPATTLAVSCYDRMFTRCTSLTKAPELPATTLADRCYSYMFSECASLTKAPKLSATMLANYCCEHMFANCTSLTNAPELPATTLANYCYQYMFVNCTSLTQIPELPAITLNEYCYQYMFFNCTSLTNAPELPATTLANYCYEGMFNGCKSLTQIPKLPATTFSIRCYSSMFAGCSSIKLSTTKTEEYTQEYRIPFSGNGTTEGFTSNDFPFSFMFNGTGGTIPGVPEVNTTYYLSSDNMITRGTEIATLNGYVQNMIDDAKVAPLIGTTNELTTTQVYNAILAGIPVKVQYTDSTYGLLSFTAFNIAESLKVIVSQTIVYYNGNYILAELFGNVIQGGGWGFYSTMLAELKDLDNLDVRVNKLEGAGYLTLETLPKYGGESE